MREEHREIKEVDERIRRPVTFLTVKLFNLFQRVRVYLGKGEEVFQEQELLLKNNANIAQCTLRLNFAHCTYALP